MTKKDKLVKRVLSIPKDLTWNELVIFLSKYGYEEDNKGKTSGSARKFINKDFIPINIHKPYPGNIVKIYAIKSAIDVLKKENLI